MYNTVAEDTTPMIELVSMVISAIVSIHVESAWNKARRQEAVLKLLKHFNIDPGHPPEDFDGIYLYALIEYGVGKPEVILDFFKEKYLREAFRQSFIQHDETILDREAEDILQRYREMGKLSRIDYDPRREFAAFRTVFHEIVDHTRSLVDIRQDQKLDEIHRDFHQRLGEIIERLDKLESAGRIQARQDDEHAAREEEMRIRGLLEAMGYRVNDMRRVNTDLYFLCEVKSAARILQEVVHFVDGEPSAGDIASLNDAVNSCGAVSGILLTQEPLPAALKQLARSRNHIQCYSLDEFTNRLADFEPYLQKMVADYEASEIYQFYIPLTVKRETAERDALVFDSLESFLDSWLHEPGHNHISLLGDFGSGKTWFCQHYAYLAAKRYLEDPSHNRIPILITLRDYSRSYDIEQLVTHAVINHFGVRLDGGYKTFKRLNEAGRLLIIFDGFDEMERRVSDYRTKVENFWELAKVVHQSSKVLLTCRTPYFRHRNEEEEVLIPKHSPISVTAGTQVIDLRDRKGFEVVHLLDFTEEDIRAALEKRLPTGWKQAYKKIEDITNLLDLASRPVLLDMIIKTLPQIQDSGQINQAMLYKIYVDTLLHQRWSEDTDYIPPDKRRGFMENLAWEMRETERPSIPYTEFLERVMTYFNLKDDPVLAAFFERDARTQSYLARDDAGNYYFAHKSFLEYFVACKMARVLADLPTDPTQALDAWKAEPLTAEIRTFLVDIVDTPDLLWDLIRETRDKTAGEVGYAGGNAATILQLQGQSFAGKDLSKARLTGADLSNCDLTGAILSHAQLSEANLRGAILSKTDLRSADLTNVRLSEMGAVEAVMFDCSGKHILSGSADGVIRLWKWETGEQIHRLSAGAFVTSSRFSPDGRLIVAGSGEHGHLKLWNAEDGQLLRTFYGHTGPVWDISFHPREDIFASGADDGSIRIWDLHSETQAQVILHRDRGIWDICYSPDGADIAVAGGQELTIYDAHSREAVWHLEQTSELRSVKYSSTNLLACSTREGKIFIYGAASKALIREISGIPVGSSSLTFSPDGCMIAIGSSGYEARLQIWEVETGEMVMERIICTNGYVGRLHWGPAGYLASGSSDGMIRVWDTKRESPFFGQCLKTLAAKTDCQRARIRGAKGLDLPAPDDEGTLHDWFIARGALD